MHEFKDRAKVALIGDFVKDAKALFLTPPVRGAVVIGIHPGVSDGCKLAVVSETGEVLETETIYPHNTNNPRRKTEAERILAAMILLHRCSFLALGNGTGFEDTETFLNELLKKPACELLNTRYRIVDVAPASFYSKSKHAATEFPHLDINVVSAISIARRLQNPVAELIKTDSPQLCNAIRRHDIPTQQLAGKLNEVITEVVSFVGVDVNTAPVALLRRVAGLNKSKAKNIVEWRKTSGPFRTRKDLKKYSALARKLNTTVETMKTIVDGLSMETSCEINWKADLSESRQNVSSIASSKIGDDPTGNCPVQNPVRPVR